MQDDVATLAERLGFSPNDRVAIIHADDIGMCHAANQGAFEALELGAITCGSLMVPCSWFSEAAELARANSGLDLGVHLTLNCEYPRYRWGPVAGRRVVPSLLDDEGYLPRTLAEVVFRAKPEEVEVELRAQIEHALASGIDVTHLDAHMGTCFAPPFIEIYLRLGEEFRVPVFATRPDRRSLEARGLDALAADLAQLLERMESVGLPILDGFDADSLGFEPGTGEEHNRARIARLRPGVTYLICHPAIDGEELRAIAPETAHQRGFEQRFYGTELGTRALGEAEVKTAGMRALRELVRGGARHVHTRAFLPGS